MKSTVRVLLCVACWPRAECAASDAHPLSAEKRQRMNAEFDATIKQISEQIAADPENVEAYSRRGDAYFFRGRFAEAVADYDKMVALNPKLETSHWRRGIAYFYAEKYDIAARQFELYHSFDDVDRENGIWRFFSQTKAYGIEKAREGLLKYQKDDREPFPAVYRLFARQTTPAEILKQIDAAKIDDTEREKRLFYAHLYIGLGDAVAGNEQTESAVRHLRQATANKWGPQGGYGPQYMWHAGRLHYELLTQRPQRGDTLDR